MPSEAAHVAKAERNERFCDSVTRNLVSAQEPYHDWVVTGLFYSILHYIDAYLDVGLGVHPESHFQRRGLVAKLHQLRPLEGHYTTLYLISLETRYGVSTFTEADVRDIRDNYFTPLRNHIRALLGV